MKLRVIEWPDKGSGNWWIVENRGTDAEPLYAPIAQHRTRTIALAVLEDVEDAGPEELEEAAAILDRLRYESRDIMPPPTSPTIGRA